MNPQLFTIATLTGHAIRAMGPAYSVCKILVKIIEKYRKQVFVNFAVQDTIEKTRFIFK